MNVSVRVVAVRHFARGYSTLNKTPIHSGHYLLALLYEREGTAFYSLFNSIDNINDLGTMKKLEVFCLAQGANTDQEARIFQKARAWASALNDKIFGTGHLLYYITSRNCRAKDVIERLKVDFVKLWSELEKAESNCKGTEGLVLEIESNLHKIASIN